MSMEVFQSHGDAVLRDVVNVEILLIDRQLDWRIPEDFSSLDGSMMTDGFSFAGCFQVIRGGRQFFS